MKSYRLWIVVVGFAGLAAPSNSQEPSEKAPPYKHVRDAIRAANATKNESERQRIYSSLQQIPATDRDDLRSLYSEIKQRANETPLLATDKSQEDYTNKGLIITARLRRSTDTALQQDIADLIDQEVRGLPPKPTGPRIPTSMAAATKRRLYQERVVALIGAAGDGKNEKARPALWRMIEASRDDYFARMSIQALAKMGKPEDLDRLIKMVETDPTLRLPFGSDFGRMVIPRIMSRIEDPSVSDSTKQRLTGGLFQAGSHDTLPLYFPLLDHSNQHVAHIAARVISQNLASTDVEKINEMLTSSSERLRAIALEAIAGRAWDIKFAPLVIEILKTAPSKYSRQSAAYCLWNHKVESSLPALQAALNDPEPLVRKEAEHSISHWKNN